MKIKMLKTVPGSTDGVTVIELQAGAEYTMTDAARGRRRAAAYFRRSEAVEVVAGTAEVVPAQAVAGKARSKK
ncbi:MAG: hypothetical protein ACOH2S_28225 [Janthinobacterium svalbardensis]|uniref:Uncharacterized protein n=1 Tax=Janthinobacterium svalbardensis TaxID=368607 RepID=A0A290X035_9BURK|nr:hypothetical protein [Janthinobacterium svalbardensis]ATD62501.1 hypothetical protein CNX70_21885 [Janthinobacterium svalbardensis]